MDIRVRLRPWLESRLNEGWIEGLCWVDKEKGIFKIPWKHHSKHTWTEEDAAIFKDWAVVTGRYRAGIDDPDWPMWKTRLRCALNKAPDIQEVKQRHNLHCDEPFKVYRFISKTESLWRANASRNACMIFDGISAVQKMKPMGSPSFPLPKLESTSRPQQPGARRTTILLHRTSGVDSSARPVPVLHRRPNGVFVRQLPLGQSRSSQNGCKQQQYNAGGIRSEPSTGIVNFNSQAMDYETLSPSNPSRYFGEQQTGAGSTTILRYMGPSPTAFPFGIGPCNIFPDVLEPEYHQLGVRIQHLGVRVKDAIITNPNGCCIYFGRYDEITSPAAPDPVEAQIPHYISEANKEYVDLLLDNMVRGIILSVTHGSIFAERMCKCAVFVYVPAANGEFLLLKKLGRREREKVFDYDEFMSDLRAYRLGQRPKPHFEVILAFGQQLRPNLSTDSLLVWCRVASCRAWYQNYKDQTSVVTEMYTDRFVSEDDVSQVSDGALPCGTGLIGRPDLMILSRNGSNAITADSGNYMSVGAPVKLEDLGATSEHEVATMGLVDSLGSDGLSSEQVIEEGVEVPLDDHDDNLTYDGANVAMHNGLIVGDSSQDPSAADNCVPSTSMSHDEFLSQPDPADLKSNLLSGDEEAITPAFSSDLKS
ncbi:unnamed protein product [Calicophoron daubneyi]|uniref:IRF tryptophan pentad repeat domain-containing protein n=1 Tax=Calicophoron daubneyi TaxID=300641 RepID=A0AAV2U0C5_CALDB